jgi:hypothetical protein
MNAGDLVWYRQGCRGGYGFRRFVPAVFLRDTGRRVIVEVLTKGGTRVSIAVMASNVTPRLAGESIEWSR